MAKKFTLTTTPRAAMPRSKRLRELGAGASTAGSASVTVNASGAPSSDNSEGHTHENKAALDRISDDRDGYSYITRNVETENTETGEIEVLTITEKVRAGHADTAHDLDEDSPVREEFLSRQHDDTARGHITMARGLRSVEKAQLDKGLEVGDYVAGESGAALGLDENGDSFAEVARLWVRVRAFFEELTVIKAGVLAGKQYITPGGGVKTVRVEETATAWRCWFLSSQDGDAVDVAIEAGDQIIAEVFNAREGTTQQAANRRFWRLATAVVTDAITDPDGNHYGYIDLSKTDCEPGSDAPQAGDELCQLGNRDDKDRQSAMVFSTVDADAPCVKLYSGINSYTLAGRAVISFGKDPQTGRIFFRLGEDGAVQFLEYRQGDGLTVAGRISSLSTISGGASDGKTLGAVLDSVGIASQAVRYSTAHTATQPADSTFTLTDVPTLSAGQYLWSRTEVVYNNGQSTKSYAVSRVGADGATGATGAAGSSYTPNLLKDTVDKTVTYTSGFDYDGIDLKDLAGEKITISYDYEYTNVTTKTDQSTRRFGLEPYLSTPSGNVYLGAWVWLPVNSTGLSGKGRRVQTVTLPAEILASRTRESVYIQVGGGTVKIWNIKVERGANADPQWTPAASEMVAPKITSTSTTYAKTSTPAQPADSAFTFASIGAANPAPGEYLWTRTVVNYSDGSATKSYSVGRIGADGTDGIPGTPGADGKSTYVHYAYANSADGVTGFSTTYFAGALYVGVCTDNNQADPTTPASYEWARLKGEAGDSVYMLDLSDEMMPMPCDAAGNVAGSYKTSQATVYKGGSVVTSGVTYSIAQATGVSATVTAAGVVTPSALTADRGSIVVQAVVAGVTLKTTLSLYKVKPGVAGAAGTNYTENLLLNSAFAKGSDKWSLSTGATIDSTKTRDGRNSVKIDVSGLTANAYRGVTQSAVLNPALQLKAGTQVTLSAWIYCDDLSTIDNTVNGVKIEIGAMNAAGNRIQAYNANAIPTKTGEWQQFTLTVTLPANTESATAFIFVTKNGRVWVNSPKLELGKNTAPVWTPNSTEMLGEDAVVYQMELSTGSVTRNALGQLSTSTITVQKYKTTGASMRGLTTEKAIRYMRVGVDTDYTALTAATSSYQIPVPNDPALTQIIVELYDGPVTLDRERIPVIQDGAVATENLVRNSEGTVTSSGPVTLNAPLGRWALHEALKPGDTYTFTVWGSVATGNSLAVRVSDLRATSLSQGALVATLAQIAPGVYSAVATVGSAITMLRYDLSTINIYQSSAQAGATIERVKVEKGANYAPIWTKSTHDIDYLTAALKESGSIEGGLILGSLMRLGYTGQKGKYNVTAGMNGIATPSDAPAVWTGGEMIDRAVSTADNAAKTMLRHDGTVYFASNTVRIGERLMQVGDNVQLDESGLSMLAGGNTALHIGDVDIAPLIDAQSINSTLAKKSCSVSNMVYSDSYGNYYPSATGSAVNLHTDECPAGTVLNCDCTISGSFGPTFENETIASSVVVDVLVGTSVIASYSCILWNGSDYRTTLNISNLRTPIKGKVSMRLRWAYDIQPDWNFVNGSPFGNTDLVITNGTLEYSTGNQTTMGRNGLLAVWGQALLSIATDAVTMKFGTHGLRVSAAGIQKLVNGNWQTANL